MNRAMAAAWILVPIALGSGCGTGVSENESTTSRKPQAPATVTVFAAASTTNALNEIRAAFTAAEGATVMANYAASSSLASQILYAADADLFLSADQQWADHVAARMPVVKRRDLLGNRLVIVVPHDSRLMVATPADLLSPEVAHLALGNPDAVPAGKYARQALSQLNLWEQLRSKVVAAEDVRHALAFVESGAAEAGIVYATDAAISTKVRVVVEIPPRLTGPIRYPLVLLRRDRENPAAEAFYDYLASPAATGVFHKYGFSRLDEESR